MTLSTGQVYMIVTNDRDESAAETFNERQRVAVQCDKAGRGQCRHDIPHQAHQAHLHTYFTAQSGAGHLSTARRERTDCKLEDALML